VVITQTGKITDDFYALGHPAVPVYLLDGPAPAIFDAGFAFLADLYVQEITKVLGSRQPACFFLTHAHFDHCGAAAAFKKSFPGMQMVASRRSADILKKPNAIELIDQLNRAAEQAAAEFGIDHPFHGRFETFAVERTIGDEESIRLATDLHVRAIETPGHTRDCFSYLIEEKNTLISSEALGQQHKKETIVTDCLSDYDDYLASLLKLTRLEADIVCPGHFYVYTGEDARQYPHKAAAACRQFRTMVETFHAEAQGDLQQVMQRIKAIEYDGNTGPRQPEVAYWINLEARIKAVLHARGSSPDRHQPRQQRLELQCDKTWKTNLT
jgi:glyoxylase-like metal-dependent hydrolase (beta-lactamase superfamily II)